ncbi:MAG: MFS transporter [Chloroflexota bacterium]
MFAVPYTRAGAGLCHYGRSSFKHLVTNRYLLITPQQRNTTVAYYLAFIGLGMASSIIGPTLKALAEQTHSGLDQISILFTFKSLGFLIGAFFVGRAYDRFAGHPIIVIAMIGMMIALILVPLVSWLVLLSGVIFLLGLAMGSLDVGGNTLLVWVHREKIGPYMNGLHFIWGAGGVISPLILIGLSYFFIQDMRWTYWLLGLYLIPILIWLARIPSPHSPTKEEEDNQAGNQVLFVGLVSLFYFLNIGAEVSASGWIVTYASEMGLASEGAAAFLSSLFFGTLTLTRLISIPFTARYRPSQLIMFDLIVCSLAALFMLLFPRSWIAILIGISGFGIGIATIFPMMLAFAQNRIALAGRVTSWFFLGGSLGGMSIPWIVGQFFERLSPLIVLYAILICTIGSAVVFGILKVGWERKV